MVSNKNETNIKHIMSYEEKRIRNNKAATKYRVKKRKEIEDVKKENLELKEYIATLEKNTKFQDSDYDTKILELKNHIKHLQFSIKLYRETVENLGRELKTSRGYNEYLENILINKAVVINN